MRNFILGLSWVVLVAISGVSGYLFFPQWEAMFPYPPDNFWHCFFAGSALGAASAAYGFQVVPFLLERVITFVDSGSGGKVSVVDRGLFIFNCCILATVAAPTTFLGYSLIHHTDLGSSVVAFFASFSFGAIFFLFPIRS